jgi:tRNA(Arg) A34 adenosine deaminase TadA
MNATNITRNGTRHAEYMAIGALLSFTPREDTAVNPQGPRQSGHNGTVSLSKAARKRANQAARKQLEASWGDVNPEDGHLYPYGQKLHPSPRVDKSVISECVLYVTVEPCVMCASLLRQLGIRKVYFGAVNDKFGGTGGVFRIHMNADQFTTSTATTQGPQLLIGARPTLPPRPSSSALPVRHGKLDPGKNSDSTEAPPTLEEDVLLEGHGGNVEPGYEVEGGWGRDEAVTLLRQFYVQENGRGKSAKDQLRNSNQWMLTAYHSSCPAQEGRPCRQARSHDGERWARRWSNVGGWRQRFWDRYSSRTSNRRCWYKIGRTSRQQFSLDLGVITGLRLTAWTMRGSQQRKDLTARQPTWNASEKRHFRD